MPRTQLLDADRAPITVRNFFTEGDPGPIVGALATVPELLSPTLSFVGAALGPGAASPRSKELAILRTSALQGCRYCIQAHTVVALDLGLSTEEVRALRGDIALEDAFSSASDRALVGWIDAVAGATGPVSDEVWESAREHWPEHVLVELTVTIGATMFLNRFATGLDLPTSTDVRARIAAAGLA